MRYKHLAFQCEYNDDETLASYAKGNYDFYDAEQIEEFVAFKGAYEITSLLENIDDAPYKSESLAMFKYCCDNYKDDNYYISDYLKSISPPKEEINALQEPMEGQIVEIKAHWMKKRRVTNKRRKNGAIHFYLLMRVNL